MHSNDEQLFTIKNCGSETKQAMKRALSPAEDVAVGSAGGCSGTVGCQ